MARTPKMSDLVTVTEIADRLGVRVSAIINWRTRNYLGFPEPAFSFKYRWHEVVAWLLETGRATGDEEFLKRYPVKRR